LKSNANLSEEKATLSSQLNSYKSEVSFMRDYAVASSMDEGNFDSLKLLFKQSDSLSLDVLGSKVVFQYKEGACSMCLTKIYQDLSILSNVIGSQNITF
jgi:hypothetical protein